MRLRSLVNEGPEPRPPETPSREKRISARTRDVIEEAAAAGFFSNLPGSGQPLDFSFEDNPFIPEGMRSAYRMLSNAGYSLPWIEDRKEIDRKQAEIERGLASHLTWLNDSLNRLRRMPAYLRPSRWTRLVETHDAAVARFTRSIDNLNVKIDIYNLKVPVVTLQVPRFGRDQSLAQLHEAMPGSIEEALAAEPHPTT